mmetsp:Transcript_26846/g.75929  ORF Transcript_26846/g.75929 Transcript_26846/m.75929 type:complete len:240 (+) Transcript_26846:888-1607(+)
MKPQKSRASPSYSRMRLGTSRVPARKTSGSAGLSAAQTSSSWRRGTSAVRFSEELNELTILARVCSRVSARPSPGAVGAGGSFQYPPRHSTTKDSTLSPPPAPPPPAAAPAGPGLRRTKATRIVPSNTCSGIEGMETGTEWQQRSAMNTGHSLDHQCRHCSSTASSGASPRASAIRSVRNLSSSLPHGGTSSCRNTSSSFPAGVTTTPAPRERLQSFRTTKLSPDSPSSSRTRPARSGA